MARVRLDVEGPPQYRWRDPGLPKPTARRYADVQSVERDVIGEEIRRRVTGPTMRAECASADVIEEPNGPSGNVSSSADCGPSFVLGPSKKIAAMIADGWRILDDPAS